MPEKELTWLERRSRTGRRFDTHSFDLRLRHPIAVAEVVVRVLEWRKCLEIERRQHFDPGKLRGILLVFTDAALSFRDVTREEDHDRMEVRADKTAHPVIGMIRSGIAKDRGARRHPLTKLFRKRRQTGVIDAKGTQAVPSERDGDPTRIERSAGLDRAAATDTVDDSGQPAPSLIRLPEAEEPVSGRQCTRPSQEEMLNVVQFQHRDHSCVGAFTASGRAWTKTPASMPAPS